MNWFIFWIVIYVMVILFFALKHVRAADLDNYLINNRKTRTLPLVLLTRNWSNPRFLSSRLF